MRAEGGRMNQNPCSSFLLPPCILSGEGAMTRPAHRSARISADLPAAPTAPVAGPGVPAEPAPPTRPVPAARLGWGWRLALFLWLTSFLGLLLYDILDVVF